VSQGFFLPASQSERDGPKPGRVEAIVGKAREEEQARHAIRSLEGLVDKGHFPEGP
jgi:hypothetical protein